MIFYIENRSNFLFNKFKVLSSRLVRKILNEKRNKKERKGHDCSSVCWRRKFILDMWGA